MYSRPDLHIHLLGPSGDGKSQLTAFLEGKAFNPGHLPDRRFTHKWISNKSLNFHALEITERPEDDDIVRKHTFPVDLAILVVDRTRANFEEEVKRFHEIVSLNGRNPFVVLFATKSDLDGGVTQGQVNRCAIAQGLGATFIISLKTGEGVIESFKTAIEMARKYKQFKKEERYRGLDYDEAIANFENKISSLESQSRQAWFGKGSLQRQVMLLRELISSLKANPKLTVQQHIDSIKSKNGPEQDKEFWFWLSMNEVNKKYPEITETLLAEKRAAFVSQSHNRSGFYFNLLPVDIMRFVTEIDKKESVRHDEMTARKLRS